jgi:ABC-type transport system substrate-binding protein
LTRRRVLKAGALGGAGAVALSLIGCGGGDEGGGDISGLIHTPVDTTNKAVKGGNLAFVGENISAFDYGQFADHDAAMTGMSRLVKYTAAKYPEKPSLAVEPDAATGWEISGDGLTYTFKLRPNMKYDPRPPTSGRVMTSADVVYSWKRFEAKGPHRANLMASVDPTAPITGISAPDANTVVFKLAYPHAGVMPLLAWHAHLPIFPVEAEDKFDTKNDMRGTGAWRIKEYVPSIRQVYEKNPDWYDAANVNPATLTYTVSDEYATNLAQFRAGNLATFEVLPEDILQTKQDLPQLLIRPNPEVGGLDGFHRFSYLPESPFMDVRVRRAVSMSWDRDLYIETFGNTAAFENAGVAVEKKWNTAIAGFWPWWMDPKGKDFGPESAVFFHNLEESNKLMTAAGFSKDKPLATSFNLTSDSDGKKEAVLAEMMHAGGMFKFNIEVHDKLTVWRPKYHYGYNLHEGFLRGSGGDGPELDLTLQAMWKSGRSQGGADADRRGHVMPDGSPDTVLNDLIAKQRTETDVERRQALLSEFQRYAAKTVYMLWGPGLSTDFQMANPWVGNWGVYTTARPGQGIPEVEMYTRWWVDDSKRA